MPKFMTIRQVASQLKILPEYRLRVLAKEGKLPSFYAGVKFMVNVDALPEALENESLKDIKEKEN